MLKNITVIFLLITSIGGHAQNFSSLWDGYFSYYDIKDITRSDTKIYAASENAIFSYDLATNELNTITTIEGLSGETITTIHYSFDYELLIIGYSTGLFEIYFESDGSILTVVDILDKPSISPVRKIINHFNEHNGLVYIATNYGISVYDLDRLEFGDSYFIGNGGSQIRVLQTTIFNDAIYAACLDSNAIKIGPLSNPNLIDYQQWQTISNGDFLSIQAIGDQLYTVATNDAIYEVVNTTANFLLQYPSRPLDMRAVGDNLVVTTNSSVYVYHNGFNLIATLSTNDEFDTQFSSATIANDNVYIGTSTFGVLQSAMNSGDTYVVIRPDGPLRNDTFKINASGGGVWATYGDYDVFINPYPLQSYGISHLVDETWNNISADSILGSINLSDIAVNPFNPDQVFISACFNGLLELNNEVATIRFDENNSALTTLLDPSNGYRDLRVVGSAFDRTGVLWTMTSLSKRPLASYDVASGQWASYSFEELIPSPIDDESGYGSDLVISANGTKWTTSLRNGVIAYNETAGDDRIRRLFSEEQNMPDVQVKSLAIDNRNQLWIGTFKGLRVLFNTSNFLTDPNPTASEIVIVEDGVPKELLALQFITDIKVDGSNNKWIGTDDAGVFYFSPDGQQTIYHFTTENSPLPSNQIRDISIDSQSGKVYIATSRGLVSFLAGGSETEDALENAYVYPNPVRPEYNILGFNDLNDITNGVKIKGLTDNVNIKITDIEGNLVAEAQSRINLRSSGAGYNFAIDGGTAIWNGKNLGNNIVASGVYLILINDLESFETKVLKLLIVR